MQMQLEDFWIHLAPTSRYSLVITRITLLYEHLIFCEHVLVKLCTADHHLKKYIILQINHQVVFIKYRHKNRGGSMARVDP